MSLEEFENTPDPKTKRYMLMRSISDIGMGILYLGIGCVIMFAKQFKFQNEFVMTLPAKIFAGLAMIYGIWRIYRGYKKDYLKKNE